MIIRTYQCDDCETVFEVTLDSGEDGDPDCPTCARVLQWVPTRFATKSNVSRAGDVTAGILEQDFGLTNFRDGAREGDATAIAKPAETTSERDARMRAETEIARALDIKAPQPPGMENAIKGFWGGGPAAPPAQATQAFLAGAKQGLTADPKSNPMSLLHQAGKKGLLPNNWKIIARSNG